MEGGAHEKLLHLTFEEAESSSTNAKNSNFQSSKFLLWLQIFIFTFFTLGGQTAGTLLGRVYYEQGGESRWLATLAQTAGFSILLPIICYPSPKNHNEPEVSIHQPCLFVRGSVYIFLGLFQVANSMLFTIGVQHLPASTYSLISGSQLAFNALTSFLLNGQKITPIILNSVVILSFSSSAVIFQNETGDDRGEISRKSLLIGFAATTCGSLGFALQFSLTELAFQKVFKSGTLKVVMKMSFFIGLFVTIASLTGLFASGNWRNLEKEMGEYRRGKLSYVITLVCTAIAWQLYAIGSIGLVFKASSLFSNVIINLGTSIVPIFAMVVLKENMSGLKVFSLLLGLWGYTSYIYQHYLDDIKVKTSEVKSSADQHDDF